MVKKPWFKRKKYIFIFIFIALIFLHHGMQSYEQYRAKRIAEKALHYTNGMITKISLSSDGQYAISTGMNHHATLWDLKNKKGQNVSDDANIYSAYFIKNTDDYIYQEQDSNNVIIKNISGKTLGSIHVGFTTYGEVLSTDLKTLIVSDRDDQLYQYQNGKLLRQLTYKYCNNLDPVPPHSATTICSNFDMDGKTLGLTMYNDDKQLLAVGYGQYFIFNLDTGKLLQNIVENEGVTYATVSPDGKYIVSADEYSKGFVYDTQANKIIQNPVLISDKSAQFCDALDSDHNCAQTYLGRVQTIKFIDNKDYLVAFNMYNYQKIVVNYHHVGLYSLDSPILEKYISIFPAQDPKTYKRGDFYYKGKPFSAAYFPDVSLISRADSIDTAPAAGVMVASQRCEDGILYYHYDQNKKILKLEWLGNINNEQQQQNLHQILSPYASLDPIYDNCFNL